MAVATNCLEALDIAKAAIEGAGIRLGRLDGTRLRDLRGDGDLFSAGDGGHVGGMESARVTYSVCDRDVLVTIEASEWGGMSRLVVWAIGWHGVPGTTASEPSAVYLTESASFPATSRQSAEAARWLADGLGWLRAPMAGGGIDPRSADVLAEALEDAGATDADVLWAAGMARVAFGVDGRRFRVDAAIMGRSDALVTGILDEDGRGIPEGAPGYPKEFCMLSEYKGLAEGIVGVCRLSIGAGVGSGADGCGTGTGSAGQAEAPA